MPVKSTKPSKEGWVVTLFERTPPMSTYLVAWAAGDFGYVETATENEHDGKKAPVRAYAVRGRESGAQLAAEVTPKFLDFYAKLFDIPYVLPELDLVAIPGMSSNDMENWGLIYSTPVDVSVPIPFLKRVLTVFRCYITRKRQTKRIKSAS